MATWSDLKIKLIATGDETGTWGATTNENFNNVIEQAITGSATITFVDANQVLTLIDSTDLQDARALRLFLTGSTTLPRDLTVPNIQKFYIIDNDLPNNITVKNPTGAETFTVPAGTSALVFSKGTGVVNAMSYFTGALTSFLAVITGGSIDDTPIGADTASTGNFTTLTLDNALAVAEGGTGVTTSTGTGSVVLSASPTLTGTPISTTATAGTNTTQIATTSFVNTAISNYLPTGSIIMWSGTIATIPSGWLLCNGTNSTPDLRNRFIIGAYSDDAGIAKTTITGTPTQTGGSKDSILVTHTHTATSTVTDPSHVHTVWGDTGSNAGGFDGTGDRNQTTDAAFTGITVATSISTEGVSGTDANLVPYFALCYIMKG